MLQEAPTPGRKDSAKMLPIRTHRNILLLLCPQIQGFCHKFCPIPSFPHFPRPAQQPLRSVLFLALATLARQASLPVLDPFLEASREVAGCSYQETKGWNLHSRWLWTLDADLTHISSFNKYKAWALLQNNYIRNFDYGALGVHIF